MTAAAIQATGLRVRTRARLRGMLYDNDMMRKPHFDVEQLLHELRSSAPNKGDYHDNSGL